MRKFLFLLLSTSFTFSQEVNVSMSPGYTNDVYYNFSDGQTEVKNRADWDLAFYQVSAYAQGIRVNDGKGFVVYEASDNVNDWENIDLNNLSTWSKLSNNETAWSEGAFNQGSATYGWGNYNPANHHVVGSVIFVLELNATDYYKVLIEDFYGGYTFKYAAWNGTTWEADATQSINNGTDNQFFNFFSFDTNDVISVHPDNENWDIVFTKYTEQIPLGGGEFMPYLVTGVLHNPEVLVAEQSEAIETPNSNPESLTYTEEINTIGYDWKSLNANYEYEMAEDLVYYVQTADGEFYRLYFTDFEGSSTGNITFNSENIENLSVIEADSDISFGIYPNPVKNNEINLIYKNENAVSDAAKVEIYSVSGKQVFNKKLNQTTGLFQENIRLNNLPKGVYFLRFIHGNVVKLEKILVQ